ncbi:MAG: hypothetical protein WBA10_10305 [Elainellaceae cyanobacterium]
MAIPLTLGVRDGRGTMPLAPGQGSSVLGVRRRLSLRMAIAAVYDQSLGSQAAGCSSQEESLGHLGAGGKGRRRRLHFTANALAARSLLSRERWDGGTFSGNPGTRQETVKT